MGRGARPRAGDTRWSKLLQHGPCCFVAPSVYGPVLCTRAAVPCSLATRSAGVRTARLPTATRTRVGRRGCAHACTTPIATALYHATASMLHGQHVNTVAAGAVRRHWCTAPAPATYHRKAQKRLGILAASTGTEMPAGPCCTWRLEVSLHHQGYNAFGCKLGHLVMSAMGRDAQLAILTHMVVPEPAAQLKVVGCRPILLCFHSGSSFSGWVMRFAAGLASVWRPRWRAAGVSRAQGGARPYSCASPMVPAEWEIWGGRSAMEVRGRRAT